MEKFDIELGQFTEIEIRPSMRSKISVNSSPSVPGRAAESVSHDTGVNSFRSWLQKGMLIFAVLLGRQREQRYPPLFIGDYGMTTRFPSSTCIVLQTVFQSPPLAATAA